jgi:hypothetical protein
MERWIVWADGRKLNGIVVSDKEIGLSILNGKIDRETMSETEQAFIVSFST